ncbi:MAG: type II toxin-antitoxin system RelE/ParE family toxin [Firmicutes bacterium]|nr:type II toxin-antitoxin system RelE/ParE family toxin [Bacillota bacterium]MCD8311106.1 type II toxin-antitoxin system RelE/ParE family toxin [Bacillota bacterium]MCD8315663.1 type II toxin-antitoxin system RelE/ParE family toxin [Bacillota bacterium]
MSDVYKVVYSPAALDDLDAIYSYIACELSAPEIAENQVNRIRKEVRSLDIFPERFAPVGWEPWATLGMRKAPVGNYVIYYLTKPDTLTVTVIRIFYGGRDAEGIINSEKKWQ